MKQEKALVSQDASSAVKPRPAVPFGVVSKNRGWCCFGENDSVFAIVKQFKWCFRWCRKFFRENYGRSLIISQVKIPSWTFTLFCGMFVLPKGNQNNERKNVMKKKIVCVVLVVMMLLSTTVSAEPWWLGKYRVTFDNELGIVGNLTLRFASDGGSFIRPITKRYGESISLESYVPTKYGYTFKGWYADPRTKQNQVTTFKFTKPDVVYAKWEINESEIINPNDEIMSKDTCYLTDEETAKRTEIIEEKNKVYIDGFGYALPAKTKTIIVDSDGDINKIVGTMK